MSLGDLTNASEVSVGTFVGIWFFQISNNHYGDYILAIYSVEPFATNISNGLQAIYFA